MSLIFLALLFVSTYAWNRADCQKVALAWKAGNVPYSQSTRYNTKQYVSSGKGPYRSDCSGFVSCAWDLTPPGATTSTIAHQKISSGSLVRCDALLKASQHVALFWGWADAAKTKPIVIEEYSTGHFCEERTWTNGLRGYTPVRRNGWDGSGGSPSPSPSPNPVPTTSGGGSSAGTCTVTATALNLRSCGSTSCGIKQVLQNGASVRKTGKTASGWVEISSPAAGWVSAEFLRCSSGNREENPEENETSDGEEVFVQEGQLEGDLRAEEEGNFSDDRPNVPLIVGCAVAGVVVLALIGALVVYAVSKRRNDVETP